jgi:pyruvate/2-oxoglutarate dehydrogenase complex dihydrolipoamide acyltransferase (E2) component
VRTMPHVTQHDEADITALEQFRKSSQSSNGRLSPWWRRVSLTARSPADINTKFFANNDDE